MDKVKVIKQSGHRNGIGGEYFIVSLVDWDLTDDEYDMPQRHPQRFVAISFPFGNETGPIEAQKEHMRAHTAVLNIPLLNQDNIEFANGNSWRGADRVGPAVVEAWEKDNPDFFEEYE